MLWQGVREPPAFTAPFADALHPAVAIRYPITIIPSDILRVNLGRLPFVHTPPEGYLPLENPSNPSSSWLTRFEHGVSVVEVIHGRTAALPPSVIDMAFAAETASAEANQLPLAHFSHSPTMLYTATPFKETAVAGGVEKPTPGTPALCFLWHVC